MDACERFHYWMQSLVLLEDLAVARSRPNAVSYSSWELNGRFVVLFLLSFAYQHFFANNSTHNTMDLYKSNKTKTFYLAEYQVPFFGAVYFAVQRQVAVSLPHLSPAKVAGSHSCVPSWTSLEFEQCRP